MNNPQRVMTKKVCAGLAPQLGLYTNELAEEGEGGDEDGGDDEEEEEEEEDEEEPEDIKPALVERRFGLCMSY